ncbi:alpha/beta hydrolase family protein [Actinomycetospora succinea]|uniref:Alpha/beta hydrolase family protein n=1 Tax=Actinomycetospora succinea TaxID=663603 RepID=A0A4R6VYP8_9PSEU|nr:alpha/beta-hydrolase family protein [Actinomycetospora succinea]TDQ65725.1 alpha/beta hydrolase family protein [Actinomycetospora succinea]
MIGVFTGLLLAVSTFPPMLPRDVVTQLVESAVLAGIGWRVDRWAGAAVPAVGVVLVGAWVAVTLGWQDAQRVDMGLGPVGWALLAVAGTAIVLAARRETVPARALTSGALAVALVVSLGGVAGGTAVAAPAPATATTGSPLRVSPVHVALPLGPGSPAERADAAVGALRAQGGPARRTVVVVVPTGSGWTDPAALSTLEAATGGDVATVAVAYDDAPSWWSYLTARDDAVATTEALLGAVAATRAPGERVLLYGQSLGALAGAEAWAHRPGAADGALWVGPPADTRTAGATVLVHPSDPAAVRSTRLLVAPPDRPTGTPWVPVVSFVQTSVDLLGAVGAPAGSGHHYGAEQRAAWDHLLAG